MAMSLRRTSFHRDPHPAGEDHDVIPADPDLSRYPAYTDALLNHLGNWVPETYIAMGLVERGSSIHHSLLNEERTIDGGPSSSSPRRKIISPTSKPSSASLIVAMGAIMVGSPWSCAILAYAWMRKAWK